MVDPIAVVVAHLKTTTVAATVGGRVLAGRAPYGDGWAMGHTAITVQPAGGEPEIYVRLHNTRVVISCWAPTERAAYGLHLEMLEALEAVGKNREVVTLPDASHALLDALVETSGISLLPDDELNCWTTAQFFRAIVAKANV